MRGGGTPCLEGGGGGADPVVTGGGVFRLGFSLKISFTNYHIMLYFTLLRNIIVCEELYSNFALLTYEYTVQCKSVDMFMQ